MMFEDQPILKIGAANRLDLPKLKVVPTVCSDSFLALL